MLSSWYYYPKSPDVFKSLRLPLHVMSATLRFVPMLVLHHVQLSLTAAELRKRGRRSSGLAGRLG